QRRGGLAEQQREVVHGGHLPVASRTLCSTLYSSDERRRANPTHFSELCGSDFRVPRPARRHCVIVHPCVSRRALWLLSLQCFRRPSSASCRRSWPPSRWGPPRH